MVVGYYGNNSSIPVWKRLGYATREDYIKATGIPSTMNGSSNASGVSNASKNYSGNVASVGGNKSGSAIDGETSGAEPSVVGSASGIGNNSVYKTGTAASVSGSSKSNGASGTGTYSYNNEARFLDWYKRNYGSDYDASVGLRRPSGMDDGVWNAGNTLYTYYLQGIEDEKQRNAAIDSRNAYYDEQAEMLTSHYGSAQESLDKSRKNAQQTSSITYDKLKKYLPTQIKAQGLGGLGVSESTMLQAQTNYTNEMSEIEKAYSENSADLASNKQAALNELEKYRTESIDSVNDTYDGIARTRENNAMSGASAEMNKYKESETAKNGESYERALEDVVSLSFTSQEEMNAYIERYRGKMSDDQFDTLLSRGAMVVSANIENKNKQIFDTEAGNVEMMFNGMLGDDDKISQADFDRLEAYVNEKGASLGDSYFALLTSQLNGYRESIRSTADQDALDKQKARLTPKVNSDIAISGGLNTANSSAGDNFEISYGDKTYHVEKGYDASDNLHEKLMDAYAASTGNAPALGAAMIYNGRIYMYLENNDAKQERWCVVQQRHHSYSEDFSDLCKQLGLTIYSRDYKDT